MKFILIWEDPKIKDYPLYAKNDQTFTSVKNRANPMTKKEIDIRMEQLKINIAGHGFDDQIFFVEKVEE